MFIIIKRKDLPSIEVLETFSRVDKWPTGKVTNFRHTESGLEVVVPVLKPENIPTELQGAKQFTESELEDELRKEKFRNTDAEKEVKLWDFITNGRRRSGELITPEHVNIGKLRQHLVRMGLRQDKIDDLVERMQRKKNAIASRA